MAEGRKKRGLTRDEWVEARRAYESGEAVLSIAKRLGARRQTIMDRAKRETWTAQPTAHVSGPQVRKTVQAKVIDLVTRQAVQSAVDSGLTDEVGAAVAQELLATSQASRLAAEYTIEILRRGLNGEIEPAGSPGEQTVADVYKAVMAGYRTFSTTVRDNAGLKPGQPSIGSEAKPEDVPLIRFDDDLPAAETA